MIDKPYFGYIKNPFLDSIELTVRADRVLRTSGRVNTLEEFMALDEDTVRRLPGAGAKTWREIREMQESLRNGHPEVNELLDEVGQTAAPASLRDQAALAALPAVVAECMRAGVDESLMAGAAWQIADAFIAAREDKTDG